MACHGYQLRKLHFMKTTLYFSRIPSQVPGSLGLRCLEEEMAGGVAGTPDFPKPPTVPARQQTKHMKTVSLI